MSQVGLLKKIFENRFLKNTYWMLSENILRLISGLFVGVYIARYLGPEQYGVFNYAIAMVMLFGPISKLGLDHILVRNLIRAPEREKILIGTAFRLRIFGAFLSMLIILLSALIVGTEARSLVYIVIISVGVVFQSFEVVDFYFQSKVQSKYVTMCKILQLLVSCFLKVIFVLTGKTLIWFVWLALFDTVTLGFSLSFAFKKISGYGLPNLFSKSLAQDLLKDSWPLIISGVGIGIYLRIDQVMIQYFMGSKEIGIYSAAVRISEIIYFVPMIISSSLFPTIVEARSVSYDAFKYKMSLLFEGLVIVAVCVAIPVSLFSSLIIENLFGDAYKAAAPVLSIHIWASIFVSLGVAGGRWLIIENLALYSMYRTVAGALVNLLLNLWLIPHFGAVGAAMATVFSQFVADIGFNFLSANTREIFFTQVRAIVPIEIFKTIRLILQKRNC